MNDAVEETSRSLLAAMNAAQDAGSGASLESKDQPHRHTSNGQAVEVTWVNGVRHQTYRCPCGEVITR